jgi:hypothetical protein
MTIIIGDLPLSTSNAITFYLDSLDICSCEECDVFMHTDDLIVPEDMHGMMCRPCQEKTGTKEHEDYLNED